MRLLCLTVDPPLQIEQGISHTLISDRSSDKQLWRLMGCVSSGTAKSNPKESSMNGSSLPWASNELQLEH